jgi:hypothetical protein
VLFVCCGLTTRRVRYVTDPNDLGPLSQSLTVTDSLSGLWVLVDLGSSSDHGDLGCRGGGSNGVRPWCCVTRAVAIQHLRERPCDRGRCVAFRPAELRIRMSHHALTCTRSDLHSLRKWWTSCTQCIALTASLCWPTPVAASSAMTGALCAPLSCGHFHTVWPLTSRAACTNNMISAKQAACSVTCSVTCSIT